MVLESVPKIVAMVYAVAASLTVIFLFRTGRFNRKVSYVLLVISLAFGFLLAAPMLPNQLQVVLLGNTKQLGIPIALAIAVLVLFIVMAFVAGRAFCSHVCPIGALQELVYLIPVKKLMIRSKTIPLGFRGSFLIAFAIAALAFSTGLLTYLGIRDLFYLSFASTYFYVFLGLLIAAVFVYRPFCRFLCPYGAMLSLAAGKSRFKLIRNEHCIDCKRCDEVCPTNEAGRADSRQECYLCNRCREICPVHAIDYGRKQAHPAVDLHAEAQPAIETRFPGHQKRSSTGIEKAR